MYILHIVGTRPNFIKLFPIYDYINKNNSNFYQKILHTGQHYDYVMSEIFFSKLNLPKPDFHFNLNEKNNVKQIIEIMSKLEMLLSNQRPDLLFVYGDVNSTYAASFVGFKLNIKIVHIEAGLRSFDRNMPEEINRILTDQLSDYLFIHSLSAKKNLISEGISRKKIFFVGNVMIDTLKSNLELIKGTNINDKVSLKEYCLVTLHRPSNVDDKIKLKDIINELNILSKSINIIFPMHPRTKNVLSNLRIKISKNLNLIDPQNYFDFVKLIMNAKFVLTDSGGVQEETTFLNVPCLTLRKNTERPITIENGTNLLIGDDPKNLTDKILKGYKIIKKRKKKKPPLWDGCSSRRILNVLNKEINNS